MILLDTSIWVDHLRHVDARVNELLDHHRVLVHPMVIGELACGRLSRRQEVLEALALLPHARVATHEEVLAMIDDRTLPGAGIGYVDAHLLAATLLSAPARLWTRDRRLADVANRLGIAAETSR